MGSKCSNCEQPYKQQDQLIVQNEIAISMNPSLSCQSEKFKSAPFHVMTKQRSGLEGVALIQAHIRGYLIRKRFKCVRTKALNHDPIKQDSEKKRDTVSIQSKSGIRYDGEIQNGQKHGYGRQVWPNGAMYEGQWQSGQANGRGTFYHSKGDVYNGDWVNNQAHGMGLYTLIDGSSYQGQWANNLQNGFGVEIMANGSQYRGDFKDGLHWGRGKLTTPEGEYEGSWLQGEMNDFVTSKYLKQGVFTWKDGRKYVGQWKNGKMHGKGTYNWGDGRCYTGDYVEDVKQGQGIYTWGDKREYNGEWKAGKQDGIGQFTNIDGVCRKGTWIAGKRMEWLSD